MTANPITVTRESPVSTVITIMLAQQISCIPVVEDDRLLGIVTTSDVLMSLQCLLRLMDQISAPTEEAPSGSRISRQVEDQGLVATGS
jgi:predicted transcriptional regulator